MKSAREMNAGREHSLAVEAAKRRRLEALRPFMAGHARLWAELEAAYDAAGGSGSPEACKALDDASRRANERYSESTAPIEAVYARELAAADRAYRRATAWWWRLWPW